MAIAPAGKDYASRAPIVDTLRRAAQERRSVDLSYGALAGRERRRRGDPYLLWLDPRAESLYLAAWAHDRGFRPAWLEALVRVADWRAPAREQEMGDEGADLVGGARQDDAA